MRRSTITLGRSEASDICLADPSISRLHAELIRVHEDALFVTDCASRNGVRVHLGRGDSHPLRQGTVVEEATLTLGDMSCRCRLLLEIIEDIEGWTDPEERLRYALCPSCRTPHPAPGRCRTCGAALEGGER